MFDKCPGSAHLTNPTIEIKKCPECGEVVEIFSNDIKVECPNCGFIKIVKDIDKITNI